MLIDSTLREGEQAYGVYFDLSTKVKIAESLFELGVDEMELGWAGRKDLPELWEKVRPLAGKTALSVWARLREDDLSAAALLKPDRVNMGFPVSDLHIEKRLNLSRSGLMDRLSRLVPLAKSLGMYYVSLGFEDATRADESFLADMAWFAASQRVSRIRLSDSLGVADPLKMARMVRKVREAVPNVAIAVHCHDDFGMATANALTALCVGATFADVSVNGIGERAGIAALEEVAAFLSFRTKRKSYNLKGVSKLSRMVGEAAKRPVCPGKAVTGEYVFSCESGLHVHGSLESAEMFEPFPADAVGGTRYWGVGGKSGESAVSWAATRLGYAINGARLPEITESVRTLAKDLGRPLTDDELSGIFSEKAA